MPFARKSDVPAMALGVDVSARRGLDLALVNPERGLEGAWSGVTIAELGLLLVRWRPAAVGIDAPSMWRPDGRCRAGEQTLLRRGIRLFLTPTADRADHPFYRWMKVGMAVWHVVEECGYLRYPGAGPVRQCALEVFPHATATLLAGRRVDKSARRQVVLAQGVILPDRIRQDGVDATLAALTVWYALRGQHEAVGDQESGWIVLPRLQESAHNGVDSN
jgi:predicted nuclease with RNAse H fold